MSDPKSLVGAWQASRIGHTPKEARTPQPVSEETQERPESLADAIMARRRAAAAPSDEDIVNSIPDLEEELADLPVTEEKDISLTPEPLPFPTSRADAIRRKLKALRE